MARRATFTAVTSPGVNTPRHGGQGQTQAQTRGLNNSTNLCQPEAQRPHGRHRFLWNCPPDTHTHQSHPSLHNSLCTTPEVRTQGTLFRANAGEVTSQRQQGAAKVRFGRNPVPLPRESDLHRCPDTCLSSLGVNVCGHEADRQRATSVNTSAG